VKYHSLAVLALSALLPAMAGAQFTTFVTPPKPRVDSTKIAPTPEQKQATADSVARVTITNMKAWVDSAAGDVVVNRTDSAGRPVAAAGPVTAGVTPTQNVASRESTTTFQEGARAPDTATWLPLLILVGAGAMGVGLVLLRWRPSA
jgi:hypothetical protein